MKRFGIARTLVVGLVLTAAAVTQGKPAGAAPLPCESGFYHVVSGTLNLINPVDGTYIPIGGPQPWYNAMGYNQEDGYLYALGTAASNLSHLLRIDGTGAVTDLGIPAGLPVIATVSGDFDTSGNLWVRPIWNVMYKIDVSAVTATPVPLSANPNGVDLVYIDGLFYMLDDTTLTVIDPATGVVTTTAVSGLPPSADYGAGWTDAEDELYFSQNNAGKIFKISNYNTANPSGAVAISGPVTGNNDGASCASARSPFLGPVATDDTASAKSGVPVTIPLPGVLSNDVGSKVTVTANTAPANGTVTLNADGSFTYTSNVGFTGVDTFTYTITDQFGRTASATVRITVTADPAPTTTVPTTVPAPVVAGITAEAPVVTPAGQLPVTGAGRTKTLWLGSAFLAFGVALQLWARSNSLVLLARRVHACTMLRIWQP